jgi:hypothetical protein
VLRHHLPPRLGAAAAVALVVLTTAACGGDDDPGPATTVTVTSSSAPSSEPPATSAPAEPTPTSDMAGRGHDLGTIETAEVVAGTTWLRLDRWTYADWSEEKVSAEGVPLTPLTDMPFRNQNEENTYAVPVSPRVVVALNSCAVGADGQPRIATAVGTAADLQPSETIWLLTYTDGVLTQADTTAPC